MANDRIFVRCTQCGEYACVGKYYPDLAGVTDEERLAEFVSQHLTKCQIKGEWDMIGPAFVIPDFGDKPLCVVFDSESTLAKALREKAPDIVKAKRGP